MKTNLALLILSFLFLCSSCDVITDSSKKTNSETEVTSESDNPTATAKEEEKWPEKKAPPEMTNTIGDPSSLPTQKVPSTAPTAPSHKVPSTAPTAPSHKVPSTAPTAPTGPKILTAIGVGECEKMKRKEFDCNCGFVAGGTTYLVTDWNGENACFGNKGEANALYPDWEERDYKSELKELATNKSWVKVHGDEISYFGKSLKEYRYQDPVEFLTDVILASDKDISVIPTQTTSTGNSTMEKAKSDNLKAIAKANDYKSKGVENVLTIQKFDNRTYDVFVRYKRLTERGGEADDYEGMVVLLKHRTTEILETKKVNGYCGC